MVTIYDIAKRANVSAMTVSRVINNTGKISDKTRAKVQQVMEELHYVPNHMARSLVLQQTGLLFLLITDIANPFYTTVARGAEDAANKHGYKLLFGNSDESLAKEEEYVQTILSTRVDGVVIAPAGDPSLKHLQALQTHGVPFVLIDRDVPGIDCDVVLGDSKDGARTLVEHLVESGHQHIAMVNGSKNISSARLRLQGFIEGMKLNDIEVHHNDIYETSFGGRGDFSQLEEWFLSLSPMPTAIISGNNVLAVEMLRIFNKHQLKVPEQISLVCFDDLSPYADVESTITVMEQQAYQFGYMSTSLLIERIKELEPPSYKKIVLPANLRSRKSVRVIQT